MRVLVGVDGSANSFAAVHFIGRLLSAERDELTLFFATPLMTLDDETIDVEVENRARDVLTRSVLDAALERLPEEWQSRASQQNMLGLPGQAILDAAEENSVDLIVVGYHGTSSIVGTLLLGSVSRKVLHSAKGPVLVVKGGPTSLGPGEADASQLHLLVAYDGENAADVMANTLQQFHWPANAEGSVLTVVRPMVLADLPDWLKNKPRDPDVAAMAQAWKVEHEENLQEARQELERFRDTLPACFAQGSAIVAEGRPSEAIISKARELEANLVVLGITDKGRLEKFLVGSTAEQVLSSGACSVLVAR